MTEYYCLDQRRRLAFPGNAEKTLTFAADHWIETALESIQDHDFFAVALSGGSTPKKIYQKIASQELSKKIDWKKVYLFWSDERTVPPDDPESNYHMALVEGKLNTLPIPKDHIFPLIAPSEDLISESQRYDRLIREKLAGHPFDLVMLGMGDDGHTASLFPHTEALNAKGKLVTPNHVPQKNTWRLTFTYDCINAARQICFYVLGSTKAEMLDQVLKGPQNPREFPSQEVGTPSNPALWIIDDEAGKNLLHHLKSSE